MEKHATQQKARARTPRRLVRRFKKKEEATQTERDQRERAEALFFFLLRSARSGAFKIERENVPKRRLSSHLGVCVR